MLAMKKKVVVTMWEITCERCGKTWRSLNEQPAVCARCHSPYYAKPRVREMKVRQGSSK